METLDDYLNATPAEQRRMARDQGWTGHRAEYRGITYEASRVTARMAERRTPTHRGEPRRA